MLVDIIQVCTLFVIVVYTFVTYKLFSTQTKQSFENTFFTLLEHQTKILESIVLNVVRSNKKEKLEGKEVFSYLRNSLNNLYKLAITFQKTEEERLKFLLNNLDMSTNELSSFYANAPRKTIEDIGKNKLAYLELMSTYTYNFLFNKYFDQFGHYFRHLFNIIKYVESKEKEIKKFGKPKLYVDLIQARMSSSELFFLFYDGILFPKMKIYINKYGLIENLAKEDLLDTEQHMFYAVKMKSHSC